MNEAFGQVLPFALVIAISPIPIVAVIAILFSQRPIANGVAFLVGWIVGVAAGLALLTLLAEAGGLFDAEGGSSRALVALRFVLGGLLLVAAWRKWRGRPRPGDDPTIPRWMSRIDGVEPFGAFVLAAVLGGVNPKNLLMNVAAASVLASDALHGSDLTAAIALYTMVASCSVALAVGYRVAMGERGAATLERMRGWLLANNATVMSLILLVFGVKIVGDAISGL